MILELAAIKYLLGGGPLIEFRQFYDEPEEVPPPHSPLMDSGTFTTQNGTVVTRGVIKA